MSYTIKVGIDGDYQVVNPESEAEIVALGERFVAYEQSLPLDERLKLPSADDLAAALKQAQAGHESARAEENRRAVAATAYHTALTQAIPLLKAAIEQLSWLHRENLAQLRDWGLETKTGARGKVLVTKPDRESEWAAFLQSYAAQELSQPEAARLTTPPFDQVQALAQTAQDHQATRTTARSARKLAVETRSTSAGPLFDLLQLAGGLLIVTRFEGRVTNALEAWGFKVKRTAATPAAQDTLPADTTA